MANDVSYQDDISALWGSQGESVLIPASRPAVHRGRLVTSDQFGSVVRQPADPLGREVEETLTAVREEVSALREELAVLRAAVHYQRARARKSGRKGRTG